MLISKIYGHAYEGIRVQGMKQRKGTVAEREADEIWGRGLVGKFRENKIMFNKGGQTERKREDEAEIRAGWR